MCLCLCVAHPITFIVLMVGTIPLFTACLLRCNTASTSRLGFGFGPAAARFGVGAWFRLPPMDSGSDSSYGYGHGYGQGAMASRFGLYLMAGRTMGQEHLDIVPSGAVESRHELPQAKADGGEGGTQQHPKKGNHVAWGVDRDRPSRGPGAV